MTITLYDAIDVTFNGVSLGAFKQPGHLVTTATLSLEVEVTPEQRANLKAFEALVLSGETHSAPDAANDLPTPPETT